MPAPRQLTGQAIVLRRVNYGEADRIVTLLTPSQGKLSAIAKGVRRSKSKLAGGIELFSLSEICFIKGKNEIDTLTSTRLLRHFGNIVKDMDRSNLGYYFIKAIDKATEDNPEENYFILLKDALEALDKEDAIPSLTELWFNLRLLKIAGHSPDLFIDGDGQKLSAAKSYDFDQQQMRFVAPSGREGVFSSEEIKFLRLSANAQRPHLLQRVSSHTQLVAATQSLVKSVLDNYVNV